jgi:hypothetical protein
MENLEAFFEISQGKTFGDAVISALKINIPERPKPEVFNEDTDFKMEQETISSELGSTISDSAIQEIEKEETTLMKG